MDQECRQLAELYAVGILDPEEKTRFEGHLHDCPRCQAEILECQEALARLTAPQSPRPTVWSRISTFIAAPKAPIDTKAYNWDEIEGGVRLSVFREDFQSGVRANLMWARPETQRAAHYHFADEEILVLSGKLIIGERIFSSGEICHIRAGTEHIERAAELDECLCFVIHRFSERPAAPEGLLDALCERCAFREIHEAVFSRCAI